MRYIVRQPRARRKLLLVVPMRPAKDTDMIQWATEIKVRAERKAGEMLHQSAANGGRAIAAQGRPQEVSKTTTLSDIGITRDQSSRWQSLASMSEDHFETAVATAKDTAGQVTTAFMLRETKRRRLIFIKPLNSASDMLARMTFFDASSYSKRTYARFRSSLALERFVSAPHSADRDASIHWAHAWLLAAHAPGTHRT